MKIGLDFDGVISDCAELKSRVAKERYGIEVRPGDFSREYVIDNGLLTHDEYRALQKLIYHDPSIGMTIREVSGAIAGIKELAQGHDVRIITSRDNEAVDIASAWLREREIFIPIISVGYGLEKIPARECDLFVDDDLEKLVPLLGHTPKIYLFGWEYNREHKHPDIVRLDDWAELLRAIPRV
jgi:uncharacterized HAD superfamily protein